MASRWGPKSAHPGWGWFCILAGLIPVAVAFGIVAVDASTVHAPMWVLALTGFVFVMGGCMLSLGQRSRSNDLLAAAVCLSLAAVGIWVSLFAPAEGFSGGVPLLSGRPNVAIARWVIGCGAALSLGLGGYAVHQVFGRG